MSGRGNCYDSVPVESKSVINGGITQRSKRMILFYKGFFMKVILSLLSGYGGFEKGSNVLDLGCGSGGLVDFLRNKGIDAVGADIKFKKGPNVDKLKSDGFLKLIDPISMRLPYEDNFFDFVVADQVVEHVKDIDAFAFEVSRVLKSGGTFIAYYPSRWKLIEPHVGVPLGGVIRWKWWFKLWVSLGAYRTKRSGPPVDAVMSYLDGKTCYRSLREVRSSFEKFFPSVKFDGVLLLKAFGNWKSRLLLSVPFAPEVFNALWSTLLVTKKNSI